MLNQLSAFLGINASTSSVLPKTNDASEDADFSQVFEEVSSSLGQGEQEDALQSQQDGTDLKTVSSTQEDATDPEANVTDGAPSDVEIPQKNKAAWEAKLDEAFAAASLSEGNHRSRETTLHLPAGAVVSARHWADQNGAFRKEGQEVRVGNEPPELIARPNPDSKEQVVSGDATAAGTNSQKTSADANAQNLPDIPKQRMDTPIIPTILGSQTDVDATLNQQNGFAGPPGNATHSEVKQLSSGSTIAVPQAASELNRTQTPKHRSIDGNALEARSDFPKEKTPQDRSMLQVADTGRLSDMKATETVQRSDFASGRSSGTVSQNSTASPSPIYGSKPPEQMGAVEVTVVGAQKEKPVGASDSQMSMSGQPKAFDEDNLNSVDSPKPIKDAVASLMQTSISSVPSFNASSEDSRFGSQSIGIDGVSLKSRETSVSSYQSLDAHKMVAAPEFSLRQNAAGRSEPQSKGDALSTPTSDVKGPVTVGGSVGVQTQPLGAEMQNTASLVSGKEILLGEESPRQRRLADLRIDRTTRLDPTIDTTTRAQINAAQFGALTPFSADYVLQGSKAGLQAPVTHPLIAGDDEAPLEFAATTSGSSNTTTVPTSSTVLGMPTRADTNAVMRQVAENIPRMVDGVVDIRLSPEELGTIRLQMVSAESGMTVHVHADRPETLELLRRNIEILAQDLAKVGHEATQFTFSDERGEGTGGNDDKKSNAQGTSQSLMAETADPAPKQNIASEGLDLRL